MYISTLISAIALAGNALATGMYAGADGAIAAATGSASSPEASITMYVVKVSNKNADLTFEPASLKAPVGSLVQFQFYPKNHSVVQAAFTNPCEPISNVMSNVTGFFSGYMPTKPDAPTMPGFTIPIKDTKPIWYYCSQAKHCQAGMVGVINPPEPSTGKTLDAFKEKAKSVVKAGVPDAIGTSSPATSAAAGYGSSPGASSAYSMPAASPTYGVSGSSSSSSSSGSSGSTGSSGSSGSSDSSSSSSSSGSSDSSGSSGAASPSGFSTAGLGAGSASGTGVARPGSTSAPFLGAANTLACIGLATFAGLGLALFM